MAARERDTFASLYERTFPRVYAYVASLLRDRAAAEDVTAQAFERAYRQAARATGPPAGRPRPGCSGSPATPRSTSCGAASATPRSTGDTEDRRPARRRRTTPSGTLRREVVRAALAVLDARERDLVALKFSGGLSNAEIARVLGTSESNAGTRLHRTVTKLRKACDELA